MWKKIYQTVCCSPVRVVEFLTNDLSPRDTLLRHSRSHHTSQHALTEDASQSPQTRDANSTVQSPGTNGSTIAETIHISNSPLREMLPVSPHHIVGCLPVSASVNMLPDGPAATGNPHQDDIPAETIPMCFLEQQYSWLPQWDAEFNLSTDWLAELTRDQPSMNWLESPILGSGSDSSQYAMGFAQPNLSQKPANPELTPISEPEPRFTCRNSVQKRWHTHADAIQSGYETPDLSKDGCEVDEACHRTLADRLRQRIQDGPVPSIAFLVCQSIAIGISILTLLRISPYKHIFQTSSLSFPSYICIHFALIAKTDCYFCQYVQ